MGTPPRGDVNGDAPTEAVPLSISEEEVRAAVTKMRREDAAPGPDGFWGIDSLKPVSSRDVFRRSGGRADLFC